ncbi:MAG: tRNA guanosine(15) transglycosylase TgtA [Candidatus Hermodarchaeota archaeon]|nr:tRNA guanosine(15) transglycosylase TgtA [Candidatus Hermodarchaeota archaeon]
MIEILQKDLFARRAKFQTKSSTVETPTFVPVVHPTRELISPRRMYNEFDCKIIITNAYLLSKAGFDGPIHDFLDYPGAIMTDSGAYQLLIYGDVDINPTQVIEYQETIGSDIAVILDVPTGGYATHQEAQRTVSETLQRAKNSISHRKISEILWVGPIQGGTYPELVKKSAKEISKLDFPIVAIGSPTQLMEQYQFDKLVDLIMAAKCNIPSNKPVHLFGAGHPMIFPLIVALGCDLFDSAAYALFAQHDRMLTSDGTIRLRELQEQFCICPTCNKYTITEMKQLPKQERIQVLAEHNLRICQNEIRRIKQAIAEGRLWRLIETRLSSHPALVNAMHSVLKYRQLIENFSPVTKRRAIFITSHWSLSQPEIIRHQQRMKSYTSPPSNRDTLLLFSAPPARPYHTSKEYARFIQQYQIRSPTKDRNFDTLFLSPFFGLVPLELSTFYPLAQNELPQEVVSENQSLLAESVEHYLRRNDQYTRIVGIFALTSYWQKFIQLIEQLSVKIKKPTFLFQIDFSNHSLKHVVSEIID